jgi:hypothetical protein
MAVKETRYYTIESANTVSKGDQRDHWTEPAAKITLSDVDDASKARPTVKLSSSGGANLYYVDELRSVLDKLCGA